MGEGPGLAQRGSHLFNVYSPLSHVEQIMVTIFNQNFFVLSRWRIDVYWIKLYLQLFHCIALSEDQFESVRLIIWWSALMIWSDDLIWWSDLMILSRKSCHPAFVFKSVVKSTGIRLNQNCLDSFIWDRKNEYSRYFFASLYKPSEVNKIMDEVTGLTKNERGEFMRGPARQNRENLINRPRRGRNRGPKKFVLVTEWNPRNAILTSQRS